MQKFLLDPGKAVFFTAITQQKLFRANKIILCRSDVLMKKIASLSIIIILLFSCEQKDVSVFNEQIKYIDGDLNFNKPMAASDIYSNGEYEDYHYIFTDFIIGDRIMYYNFIYLFYILDNPNKPQTLCRDPLCQHRYDKDNCVTSWEHLLCAPVAENLFLSSSQNKDTIYKYNTADQQYEVYARFSGEVSRLFSLGKYLYVGLSYVTKRTETTVERNIAFLKIDTVDNTACYLYEIEDSSAIRDLYAYKGKFYYLFGNKLMVFDENLSAYKYNAPKDITLADGCEKFEIKDDRIYYTTYGGEYDNSHELRVYDMITGEDRLLLGNVYLFTVSDGKIFAYIFDPITEKIDYNSIKIYSLDDALYGDAEIIDTVKAPERAILAGNFLYSGQGSIYTFMGREDHDPQATEFNGYYRYYIKNKLWQGMWYGNVMGAGE